MGDIGFIYKVRNTANGKCYVGCTGNSVSKRWQQHLTLARQGKGSYLHAAIRKYGEQAFVYEVLATVRGNLDELWNAECAAIAEHKSLVPFGYNLTPGGEGVDYSSPELRLRHKTKLAESRALKPDWRDQVDSARQKALLVLRQQRENRDASLTPGELEQREKERTFWRAHEARRWQPGYTPEPPLQSANEVKQKAQIKKDAETPPDVLARLVKDRVRKKASKKVLSPTWRLDALQRATAASIAKTAEHDSKLPPDELAKRLKQRASSRASRERRARGVTAQQERDLQLPPEELARRLKIRAYDATQRAKKRDQM